MGKRKNKVVGTPVKPKIGEYWKTGSGRVFYIYSRAYWGDLIGIDHKEDTECFCSRTGRRDPVPNFRANLVEQVDGFPVNAVYFKDESVLRTHRKGFRVGCTDFNRETALRVFKYLGDELGYDVED